ncbi:MAG: VCBS repeat-containing protein [Saprospiraceae bacterium]|nr:VCBS repeat-containing protein [Saprospiraceae bacterium]
MTRKSGYISLWGLCLLLLVIVYSCQDSPASTSSDTVHSTSDSEGQLFTKLLSKKTGIEFQNKLVETKNSNYYKYMYSYIGGGVAAADFNRDGNVDLFFTANTTDNKLYLNKGALQFLDATEAAGIEQRDGFDAGVTVVDVNADGWLDIYVTRGGANAEGGRFANMLFINQGTADVEAEGVSMISFKEEASKYGLADDNRGINATFFDYDQDGDLDAFIANAPDFVDKAAEIIDLSQVPNDPQTQALKGFDRLYQNDGAGHFTDVSVAAGILPDIGFGLNPQIGDLNQDGWLDIYVCNDFRIPDFAYLNNGDGTFREGRNELLKHMSFNSMGSDYADLNNDGLLDLFALDMNPEDYVRSKTTMAMTSLDRFAKMVEKDHHYQYMHNMLQLNNGNGSFREIANLAGVANTDWSWSCLLADFDLDGYNDIYVTNGVFRDVIDRDANNQIIKQLRENNRRPTDEDFLAFTQMLPQQKLANYIFRNRGDLSFENMSATWTDSIPTFSNGAVYADLDNDGDLELVINNINEAATILKNNAIEQETGNYLAVHLEGPPANPSGVGAMVVIQQADDKQISRQLINTRGFLSAVGNRLYFGLGDQENIARIEVRWPDGRVQELQDVQANQTLSIKYASEADSAERKELAGQSALLEKLSSDYVHLDPSFNDFEKQILLPHKLSQTGPAIAKADVNGDGITDLFIGGGHTQPGQLLLGSTRGKYTNKEVPDFRRDRQREDVGACFFDADQDGDQDLYVVSGSYEFSNNSKLLMDRIYINDGRGNFSKQPILPMFAAAGSVVTAADYDQDGDQDLFVGGRVSPGQYPIPPVNQLLLNEGGKFSLVTQSIAPELERLGMITDAHWADIDQDQDLDLIVTGEWLGIEVFTNENGKLTRSTAFETLQTSTGWWNKLLLADIDQDGDLDIIAGNQGLNYKIHASRKKPFHVYTNDFDYNGTVDIILAKDYKGSQVPVRGKTCSTQQLPHLANKVPTFKEFANSDLEEIIGPGLKTALHLEVVEFRSGIFINNGPDGFSFRPFTNEIQASPVNSMVLHDFDGDQIDDLLLAGNNHMAEVETTRSDAGIGALLKGEKEGQFHLMSHLETGFFADKDVRHLLLVRAADKHFVWVINNNERHDIYALRGDKSS